MTRPLVSIICPTYMQERHVEATVRSLCTQTWPKIEVLVADDGSTDQTVPTLRGLAREFKGVLKVIPGDVNQGIARNTNRALLQAQGDLVAFCGGDDLFLPGKVAHQVEWFEANPEAVLCAHDAEYFDSATGAVAGRQSDLIPAQSGAGPSVLLARGNIFHAITVVVRHNAIPSYGVDERIPIANDYKLWIDCLASGGGYAILPDVLARYRIGVSNVTRTAAERIWREAFLTLGIVESQYPEFTSECREGRARLLFMKGLERLDDAPAEAREWLVRSLHHSATSRRSWPFWYAMTLLPKRVRKPLVQQLAASRRSNR